MKTVNTLAQANTQTEVKVSFNEVKKILKSALSTNKNHVFITRSVDKDKTHYGYLLIVRENKYSYKPEACYFITIPKSLFCKCKIQKISNEEMGWLIYAKECKEKNRFSRKQVYDICKDFDFDYYENLYDDIDFDYYNI